MALAPGANGTVVLTARLRVNGAFGKDCGGVPVWVYGVASAAPAGGGAAVPTSGSGVWADGALTPGGASAASNGSSGSLGAWVAWAGPASAFAPPLVITLRVAVSYVSAAGAVANLAAQQAGGAQSFDAAAAAATAAWDAALSVIAVTDVGYTDADVEAHRARLDRDAAGAVAARALHAVPGREPSDAGRAAAASSAAAAAEAALARTPSGRAWLAAHGGAGAAGAPALAELASRRRGGANSALPTAMTADRAGAGAATMGLGLPPHPVGMPPAERLGSFYSSLYHVFSAPTVYSDSDGRFTGMDRAVHSASWRGGAGRWMSDL